MPRGFKRSPSLEKKIRHTRNLLWNANVPEALPESIEYHRSPSPMQLRELYDRASIFVAPSRTEGWGLTGCEALLCGAALVATDIDGHGDFALDGQTALTSPARSPERLAENVNRLLKDPQFRIELAKKGMSLSGHSLGSVQRIAWSGRCLLRQILF